MLGISFRADLPTRATIETSLRDKQVLLPKVSGGNLYLPMFCTSYFATGI
jgi:5-formyltetrahydrofolate cyclo-ligase